MSAPLEEVAGLPLERLAEITNQSPLHPCFSRGPKPTKDPSWQEFEFHLPGDAGCKIRLTVLAFHIPPK